MPSLEAEISISIFAEYPQLFDRLFKHKQSSQNFLENLKLVQKPHFVLIAIAPMFAYLLQTLICHSMYSLIYTCIILLEYILYCIIYIYQLYSRMLLGSKIPNIFLVIHQHLHHQNFGLLYKMTNTVSLKFYRAKASWLLYAVGNPQV